VKIKHIGPDGKLFKEQILRATGYAPSTEILLQDGHLLKIVPSYYESFGLKLDSKLLWSGCVSFVANLLILSFLIFSFRLHGNREIRTSDISKVQAEVAHFVSNRASQTSDNPSLQNQREVRRAEQMMKSWGVGKPIAHANKVLKPSIYDQAFSKQSGGALNSWALSTDIDDQKLEKPLNLSEEEISKALRAVSSELRECYNQVLIRDTELKGKPQLVVDINQSGRVQSVELLGLRAKDSSLSQLRNCFFAAYRQVALRKPNQSFIVTQTIVLDY
jgi:hypothetical protein